MTVGHRQGVGVGGCLLGVVCETLIVRSEFSVGGGRTHVSNIRWGSLWKLRFERNTGRLLRKG